MSRLPSTFDEAGLREAGFEGFESVATLRSTRLGSVPKAPGVYAIVRAGPGPPVFRGMSTGGWFKGLDPSDPIEVVEGKWIEDSKVIYIGNAQDLLVCWRHGADPRGDEAQLLASFRRLHGGLPFANLGN